MRQFAARASNASATLRIEFSTKEGKPNVPGRNAERAVRRKANLEDERIKPPLPAGRDLSKPQEYARSSASLDGRAAWNKGNKRIKKSLPAPDDRKRYPSRPGSHRAPPSGSVGADGVSTVPLSSLHHPSMATPRPGTFSAAFSAYGAKRYRSFSIRRSSLFRAFFSLAATAAASMRGWKNQDCFLSSTPSR